MGVEQEVQEALQDHPTPEECPPSRQFVPPSFRQWGPSSKVACHPGFHRTLAFIPWFWWFSIAANVWEYVAACSICAHCKAVLCAPAGLLHPLPIPSRPWSHITVDLVTGLPPSEGSTTILSIVDCFSQVIHFVLLPKLPSAIETCFLPMFSASPVICEGNGPEESSWVSKSLILDPQLLIYFYKLFPNRPGSIHWVVGVLSGSVFLLYALLWFVWVFYPVFLFLLCVPGVCENT